MIELKNVTKVFGTQKVLDQANLTIGGGEITTIIGKSGTGKTVILKHIIGLMKPDSGRILFEGRDLARMTRQERKVLKSRCGFMFQNVALFDSMTAYDNVALPLREKTRLGETQIRDKVMEKLEELEVGHTADKFPAEISGGMKKRVGLARVLVTQPQIILFDEPTTGLDPIRKNAVHSMISQTQRQFGFTAVMVSHEIPDVFYFSHKIAVLDSGKIIYEGVPDRVRHCRHEAVQELIHGVENIKDELTGLDSNQKLFDQYEEQFERARAGAGVFSIVVFTIHNLETVNVNLGFSVGQRLFQRFAVLVRSFLPSNATLSKFRSDTIVALLPEANGDQSDQVVKVVQHALELNAPLPNMDLAAVDYGIEAGFVQTTREMWMFEQALDQAEAGKATIATFQTC